MSENSVIVWIDVETTGLDPQQDRLLEFGMVATTPDLEPVGGEFSVVIGVDTLDVKRIDPGVIRMHSRSGLLEEVVVSVLSIIDAEAKADNWLRIIANNHNESLPLVVAGSTVAFDRAFVRQNFDLERYFHYRSIDVSTIKELVRRWYGEDFLPMLLEEPAEHRSIPDIHRSIEELRYYRKAFFVNSMRDPV